MSKLEQWLNDGKHLPDFMRDFHDQKEVFKVMHAVQDVPEGFGPSVSWRDGHIYVIDRFLWYMARRGYALQKSRAKQEFLPFAKWADVRGPSVLDLLPTPPTEDKPNG